MDGDAVSDDSNLNDIISTIKQENEQLLAALHEQKAINAQLQSNTASDYHSIPSRRGSPKSQTEAESIETVPDTKPVDNEKSVKSSKSTVSDGSTESSDIIIEKQKQMIQDLSDQLQNLRSSTDKQIKKLQVRFPIFLLFFRCDLIS